MRALFFINQVKKPDWLKLHCGLHVYNSAKLYTMRHECLHRLQVSQNVSDGPRFFDLVPGLNTPLVFVIAKFFTQLAPEHALRIPVTSL